jgi:hypothetical protein
LYLIASLSATVNSLQTLKNPEGLFSADTLPSLNAVTVRPHPPTLLSFSAEIAEGVLLILQLNIALSPLAFYAEN